MLGEVAFILGLSADPFSFLLALAGVAMARRWWHLLLVGVSVALLISLAVAAINPGSPVGVLFIPRVIVGYLHTGLAALLIRAIRRRRAARRAQ